MPLYDAFGRPLETAPVGPPLKPHKPKKKPSPRNLPRKPRRSVIGAQHQQQARMVTVTLCAHHNINGASYGPGPGQAPVTITVRRDLADALLEAEGRAAAADAAFVGTKACVIAAGQGGGFKTTRVAPEYFDIANQNALPFGVISKQGAFQQL